MVDGGVLVRACPWIRPCWSVIFPIATRCLYKQPDDGPAGQGAELQDGVLGEGEAEVAVEAELGEAGGLVVDGEAERAFPAEASAEVLQAAEGVVAEVV